MFAEFTREYYSASPARLGELVITKQFLDEYEVRHTRPISGTRAFGTHSDEYVRKQSEELNDRIAHYYRNLEKYKSGDHITLADVERAVKGSVSTGNPKVAVANLALESLALLEKQMDYADGKKNFYQSGEAYARMQRGFGSNFTRLHEALVDSVENDPNLAKIFDRARTAQVMVSTKDDRLKVLSRKRDAINKELSGLANNNSEQARDYRKALGAQKKVLDAQIGAAEKGQSLDKKQIEKLFGEISDELRSTMRTQYQTLAKEIEEEKSARQAQRDARLKELEYEAYSSTVNSLANASAKLGGEEGRKLGMAISAVGNGTIKFIQDVDKARELIDAVPPKKFAAILKLGSGGLDLLLNLGSLIGSLFGGGPSIEEIILKEIQALRKEVQTMRQEMFAQFNGVHEHLNQVYVSLLDELGRIERNQAISLQHMTSALRKLDLLGDEIVRSSINTREMMNTLEERLTLKPFESAMMDPLDGMNDDMFLAGMNSFKTCIENTNDAIKSGKGIKLGGSPEAVRQSLVKIHKERIADGEEWKAKEIGTYFNAIKRLYPEARDLETAGNPAVWLYCARLYLKSLLIRPEMYQRYLKAMNIGTSRPIEKIRNVGLEMQHSFDRIPPQLIKAILADYTGALNELKKEYHGDKGRKNWLAVHLDNARDFKIPFSVSNLNGIDPWIRPQEYKSQEFGYVAKERKISRCSDYEFEFINNNLAPELAVQQGFDELLFEKYRPYLIAERLGLGALSFCYKSVRWENFNYRLPLGENGRVVQAHLAFDIEGHYAGKDGKKRPIFVHSFVSPKNQEVGTDKLVSKSVSPPVTEWQPTGPYNGLQWKAGRIDSKLPYARTEGSELADQLKDQWPTLAQASKSSTGKDIGKEATQHRKSLEETLDGLFSLARLAIHDKVKKVAKHGGDGGSEALQNASVHLDSSRDSLDLLLSYRLPVSSRSDQNLAHLISGLVALPKTEGALDALFFPPRVLSINSQALRTLIDKMKQQMPKPSDEEIARQELELEKIRVIEAIIKYTQAVRGDSAVARDLGITPEEVSALQAAINKKELSLLHLIHLSLFGLYKAVLTDRLDKPGYREDFPEIKEMLNTLNLLIANFQSVANGSVSVLSGAETTDRASGTPTHKALQARPRATP